MHEQGIAIYSRKSRFTGKGESVGNQIELCRQYLRAHEPDAPEPEIFEDDGFSGGDLNRPAFRRMMKFIILTYSFALLTYWLFPNCQHLRPVLSDNDVLTRLVSMLYRSDTNTNVCPSIHVIGSFAVYFAARDSRMLSKPPIRLTVFILTVLISISTVFLKQHSVLDVLAGLLVCAAAYPMIYPLPAHHALPAPAVMQKRTVL